MQILGRFLNDLARSKYFNVIFNIYKLNKNYNSIKLLLMINNKK